MSKEKHGLPSDSYVVIQGYMCNEMGLKGNDLLVYALINGFTQDGVSKFYGGRQYIADTFNISLPTVDKALSNLVEMDYIIKEPCKTQAETAIYYINISRKETLLGVGKKLSEGSKETFHNNTRDNTKEINNTFTNVKVQTPPVRRHLVTVDNTVDTTSKPKKKNLYEKCLDDIDNFTQDSTLRGVLVTYLKMRLEMKDSPIYHNQWVGLLNNLKKLSNTVNGMVEIVQQSINRGYKGFFEVKQYGKKGGQDPSVFSEYGQVKSVRSNEVAMNVQF